jgi:hypothetical protein
MSRECLSDRLAGLDGGVQTGVDLGLRIWKAGTVLAGLAQGRSTYTEVQRDCISKH